MANSNDTLFSINAGKILATLHLAGVTQAPNYKPIINTGVKNCTISDTPENPGKAEFDFTSKDKYEIGFFKEQIYPELINLELSEELQQKQQELDKFVNAQKLTDTNDKVKAKKEEILEIKQKLSGSSVKEFDKIDDDIKKINESRQKQKEKVLNKFKSDAFKDIKQYMETFSGKEHASKLKIDEIVVSMVNTLPKDVNEIQVKAFKIQDSTNDETITKEVTTNISEQLRKAKTVKDLDKINMPFCYKIGFSVESATM